MKNVNENIQNSAPGVSMVNSITSWISTQLHRRPTVPERRPSIASDGRPLALLKKARLTVAPHLRLPAMGSAWRENRCFPI